MSSRAMSTTNTPRKAREEEAGPREGERRFGADIAESLHRNVRLRIAERRLTLKQYLVWLLEQDGVTTGAYVPLSPPAPAPGGRTRKGK